ncbi:cell wall hydrolase [Devosia sp. PTR5]|uniref:Cell wall hydrolase n=1 Tax=Devosia oryzisoli TaxID=2774138 RepID=A0A927ISE2_9HYPH|nr:cell wall hydrolase [Devosia oryzisoli]
MSEKECMMRAMYFESNRSSADGMLAVGTVVMNRLHDPRYPKTVCGVVGQKNQFADGVMNRKMTDSGAVLASQMADAVLSGARHPGVRDAQHFHTAGLRFPYNNMHYVLEAGGNEFYEKW